tara:strand:+ start:3138 stop:3680 length:543 start_codon:yes stop_codon:yes gene_type:complete
MSNIGKQPITIPDGVDVNINKDRLVVKGKLGELSMIFKSLIKIDLSDNVLTFKRMDNNKSSRELHGLYRALVNNMVEGVTNGYKKELNMNGVGYTAELKNDFLLVNAGYSHPVYLEIPTEVKIEVPNPTTIIISGVSKQNVGDVAAKIRSIRKPEPYKGKGIKYSDEIIRRKAGKTVGGA